jgi:hypothetical protein
MVLLLLLISYHIISYMVVNATRLAVLVIVKVMFGSDRSRSSIVQARFFAKGTINIEGIIMVSC